MRLRHHLKPELANSEGAKNAWSTLHGEPNRALTVDVIKLTRDSQVYRLSKHQSDQAVIAKRTKVGIASIEKAVYEQILPEVGHSDHGYLGSATDEASSEFAWIFLEDFGPENYKRGELNHEVIAANWVGILHSKASYLHRPENLPVRDMQVYANALQSVEVILNELRACSTLTQEQESIVDGFLRRVGLVQEHWSVVSAFCQGFSPTIVHGDLVMKNIRVRGKNDSLRVFDWEYSSWGVPAEDLANIGNLAAPNLEVYRKYIGAEDLREVQRLERIGVILRTISSATWSCQGPHSRAMGSLPVYSKWLDDCLPTALGR